MSLDVGSRLGHYDVTAPIDEGGMGEVYRARDTKLDYVGLKILFTDDPYRLARFERETRPRRCPEGPGSTTLRTCGQEVSS